MMYWLFFSTNMSFTTHKELKTRYLAGDGGNYAWIINPNDRITQKSEQHYSNA